MPRAVQNLNAQWQLLKMTQHYDLVVLGAAESGIGAAILAQKLGLSCFVSDFGTIAAPYKAKLQALNIPFEEGGHTTELVLAAKTIVKSPGIADKVALVQAAKAAGIPVISEIEFALQHTEAQIIGTTGSNGKTTTTLLTHHLLVQSGIDAGLAGNVGHSLAAQVAENPKPLYVVELSSFQLDGMFKSHVHIAVLLNITPDHLDRYNYQFENYAAAKFRIIQNQTAEDVFIVAPSSSTEVASRLHKAAYAHTPARIVQVGSMPYADDKGLVFAQQGWHLAYDELPLRGAHNAINIMCALQAALEAGAEPEKLLAALKTFRNAPHRLQEAGKLNGVLWVNDSKATNVDSVFYALQSFAQPIVLILGGVDKGNDYSQIASLVQQRVKAIVMMGKDNSPMEQYFTSANGFALPLVSTHSLEDACQMAQSLSEAGDVVLLSPACASFDLFKNYEDRGAQFMAWVREQA